MERAELLDILTDASRLYVNYVERQLAQLGIHSGQGSLLSAWTFWALAAKRNWLISGKFPRLPSA